MNIIFYIFFIILIFYSLLMFLLYIYWILYKTNKNKKYLKYNINDLNKIIATIIITVKNEEDNILNILNSLIIQKNIINKYEIIIADDFSSDNTISIVKQFINNYNSENVSVKLIRNESLPQNVLPSKKQSQESAINIACGEIIILTDADCVVNDKWLISILKQFDNNSIKLVSGPVQILTNNCFFSRFQALEFASLIISGGALINLGKPVLANAANLAFRKNDYLNIVDFISFKNISSGDDVFLMAAFKKHYGSKAISFLKETDAIVYTKPQKNLKAFIDQRVRWASKSAYYNDFISVLLSLLVYSANFSVVFMFFACLSSLYSLNIFIYAFVFKVLSDFIILYAGLKLFNSRNLLCYYLPMAIIYPFYIIFIPLLSLFYTPRWKGLKIVN